MDTIAWVSIVCGLSIITLFFLAAMIIMRRRERARANEDKAVLTALERIDDASDDALTEINQTAKLAVDEINEKYQAMLFLYNLLDEKKKEIAALTSAPPEAPPATTVYVAPKNKKPSVPTEPKKPRRAAGIPNGGSTKNEKIFSLYNDGHSIANIAKQLNIGQGEVQLIVDLTERQG